MEELLKTVAEKTGLPLDKAQGAIDAVMDFMKDKLPAPISAQIEKFMGGDDGDSDDEGGITDKLGDMAGGVTDKLGGLFGKRD